MARQADLLSVEEARRRILQHFQVQPEERVDLDDALGRVLATEARASHDVPPFTNSSMDGFAVQSSETREASFERPARLPIAFTVAAGTASEHALPAGTCARIMTGAPLPEGADAVVPFEEVTEESSSIVVTRPIPVSACVRVAGQDFRAHSAVLSAGTTIGPYQLALLAALGGATVTVRRRPRVAVLSTGDELVVPGLPLGPGQIYNSNTPMLVAAVDEAGGLARRIDTVEDTPESVQAGLAAAAGADLLLTSGGASVGDFDYVQSSLRAAGVLNFWRVRIRPGKPLIFGSLGGMPVLGLPGNPTSSAVTFEQFARPAIRAMLGLPPLRPQIRVVVDNRIDNAGGRRTFMRVRLSVQDDGFHASLAGPQDSAMIAPLAAADGLLEISEDREIVLPGETAIVQVWQLPHTR